MRNAIVLHGKPTKERYLDPNIPKPHEANWFPWIYTKLTEAGIETSVPPLPRPYFPEYEEWKKVFETEEVDNDTGLVGHSAGAEFILRWLSKNYDKEVEKVILVAPYCDYKSKYGDFSTFDLDKGLVSRVGSLTMIYSLDDDLHIQKRVNELADIFPEAKVIALQGYGHFRIGHNMTGPEFPELLREIVG